MNNLISNQSRPRLSGDIEISLIDILRFLKGSYRPILIAGIVGLALALAYLAVTPKRYEAVAQIAMAQIEVIHGNSNNLNPLGVSIEESPLLIARFSLPTSFTPEVLSSCGVDEGPNRGAMLTKAIKLAPLKAVSNAVELKTFGKSPEAALTCAQAIFDLIKVTQAQIVAPYNEEAKTKLLDDEERLSKARNLIARADKTGQAMGAAYLSTRDEIRYLFDQITSLKNAVNSNQIRVTRLIAPIYASETPIAPKKMIVLMAGLLGGFLVGLLMALGRQIWIKLKAEMQEQGQMVR